MTDTTVPDQKVEATGGKELHLGWALVLISVAQLMVVLDGTIVNIALPYIQADLDIADANLRGSSPAMRWPSAACCCSAVGSVTSTAADGSS